MKITAGILPETPQDVQKNQAENLFLQHCRTCRESLEIADEQRYADPIHMKSNKGQKVLKLQIARMENSENRFAFKAKLTSMREKLKTPRSPSSCGEKLHFDPALKIKT